MDESTYLGPTAAAELAKLAKETAVTVDDRLDAGSTHPVQNKVVTVALNAKAGKDVATSGADGLMSAADKAKLDKMSTDALPTPVLNPTNVQALVVDIHTSRKIRSAAPLPHRIYAAGTVSCTASFARKARQRGSG